MGRSPDGQLTIPSQRVSRRHAEIVWRAGFPVLRNLSTHNPTLVNDKAIEEHELRDQDELQVGPYRCVYRLPLKGLQEEAEGSQGITQLAASPDMVGKLALLNLFELLRGYELNGQTGTLTITHVEEEGRIVLEEGELRSARLGKLEREAAVYAMLPWREGSFRFVAGETEESSFAIIRRFDLGQSVKRAPLPRLNITALLAGAPIPEPAKKERAPVEPRRRPPEGEGAAPPPGSKRGSRRRRGPAPRRRPEGGPR